MGALLEGLGDDLKHPRTVQQDLVVPEPQHAPTPPCQEGVAAVVITRLGVLAAVSFNHQLRFDAGEVDDIGRDRILATEPPSQLA